MAYSTRMAAALSGATAGQIRHWRYDTSHGPVLVPELASRPRALYSFRDVLALRAVVYLRREVSLQKVRTALGTLRGFGELEHLSSYSLATEGDTIVLVTERGGIDLVKKPGQVLLATMAEILEPFSTRPGVVVPRLFQPRRHLTVDPRTQGGVPVIAGTRVPYDVVAELVEDGITPDRVADYYPAVGPEAARDAVDFALYVDSFGQGAQAV
ncbi:DUF433 domain-containing protein [Streptomyces sp. SID3343]|uniref:DUF433 domain-containing protein n=1 Tax=Streptomyces sp. SID3343 TaxID=2690260 RepID=UPI001F288236|nr:DUF433 domain-containing protein [Streptomyces sp. SID3343]